MCRLCLPITWLGKLQTIIITIMNFWFYKRRKFSDLLKCHLLFKTQLVFKV
jgi:hypothetical protein